MGNNLDLLSSSCESVSPIIVTACKSVMNERMKEGINEEINEGTKE